MYYKNAAAVCLVYDSTCSDSFDKLDYLISKNGNNPGRPTEDYIVTMDMAKELCMVSNTVKGKETRKYFIDRWFCEAVMDHRCY